MKFNISKLFFICSIIRVVRTDRLMSIRSISESIPGLLAYSERHFSRVDRCLISTIYILILILCCDASVTDTYFILFLLSFFFIISIFFRLHQATYVLEYMSSLMSLLPLEDSRLLEDSTPSGPAALSNRGSIFVPDGELLTIFAPLPKILKKKAIVERSVPVAAVATVVDSIVTKGKKRKAV